MEEKLQSKFDNSCVHFEYEYLFFFRNTDLMLMISIIYDWISDVLLTTFCHNVPTIQ